MDGLSNEGKTGLSLYHHKEATRDRIEWKKRVTAVAGCPDGHKETR